MKWSVLSKYRNQLYGFTILWIILFHGIRIKKCELTGSLRFLSGYLEHGNCGVEVFLFLSGLGLFYSMHGKENIIQFYVQRMKRILLPMLIIDGIYWLYLCFLHKISLLQLIKNITFYSFWFEGYGMVWYVALSVVLYIFYPFIYKFWLNNPNINKLLFLVIGCIMVYLFCYIFKMYDPKWYKGIEIALTRIPVFLIGCYCGLLSYENKEISTIVKTMSLIMVLVGIAYFFEHPVSLVKSFRTPYLFVGPSIALWGAICLDILNNKHLNRILCILGGLSLELYLSHIVLLSVFTKSFLYGKSTVANFNKYVLFVLLGSYVISIVVKHLHNKLENIKV